MTPADGIGSQRAVIAFLADPATHGGAAVERIDTHISSIFLAGERAYKLKRAVRLAYLDWSTVERRQAACEAEVAVNRRTAPDLYLGVRPVVADVAGALRLGEANAAAHHGGRVLDWLVVMRRFDQDGLFDRLAMRGALGPDLVRRAAETIASLHKKAAIRSGGAAPFSGVVEDNLAELQASPTALSHAVLARLRALSMSGLERLAPLLNRRAREGRVRRGHGDLHLRNICLVADRPVLFDALEFDEALASVDVLYDLGFLLMDLEHRALRALGNVALNRYLELQDELDGLPALPLFMATRAAVRAKIAAAGGSASEATSYLDLAIALLVPVPSKLIAVGGLSGTGKTTLARSLAPQLGRAPGAVVLRSDIIRKRLFGVAPEERLEEAAYSAAAGERVYRELAQHARTALDAGQTVVADAVFARPAERRAIEAAACDAGVPFVGIWLSAASDQLVSRIAQRRDDASDATPEIVRRQLGYDLGEITWTRIDADRPPDHVLQAAASELRR